MAEESGHTKSLQQLRGAVADSRDRLARDLEGLRYELDFPLKFRKSFQRQTVIWIGAVLVVGIAAAVMPASTKKVRVPAKRKYGSTDEILGAGLALGTLKIALTLLRPTITRFVSRKVSDYVVGPGRRS